MSKPQLSEEQRQRLADMELSRRDLLWHLENHVWIKDNEGEIRLMRPLRQGQRMFLSLLHHIDHIWSQDDTLPTLLKRVLILKIRKEGFSTLGAAMQYLEVKEHDYDGVVIAQDLPTAQYIFQILKRCHNYYDLPKPDLERTNKREIKFKDREGYIEVFTANQVAATRGRTPQIVHGSEVAHWEKGSETAVSLFQAVAKKPNTSVILETTANGEDLLFKPLWDNAYEHCRLFFHPEPTAPYGFRIELKLHDPDHKWNGFFPFFVSALDSAECRVPMRTREEAGQILQTLDTYEKWLVDEHKATPEFIKWLRDVLRFQCQGNHNIRKQEYPIVPEEAFIISGDPRFDVDALDQMPVERGTFGALRRSDDWQRRIHFREDSREKLQLFRMPQPGHRYVIGVDTAEGNLPEGALDPDESVAIVLDIDDGPYASQVAVLAGQLAEEQMADRITLLAEFYNMAYIVPEWVGGHGEHLIAKLCSDYDINRLYHKVDPYSDQPTGRGSHGLGLRVHSGNRNHLISDLANVITERSLRILDSKLRSQCRNFVWNRKGRVEARRGHHDDHVMALLAAVHGWLHYPQFIQPSDGVSTGVQQQRRQRYPQQQQGPLADAEVGY